MIRPAARSAAAAARAARRAAALVALACVTAPAPGAEVLVAVAANFQPALERLAGPFDALTGHAIRASAGSTGTLYTQIVHGAPFHVLLAADSERPARLEREGRAVSGSRFTYAVGRLTLWSRRPGRVPAQGAGALARDDFRHLAIANPALAPYGRAARQALEALGLWTRLRPRLVIGQNVGQAWQFVATGNAELGLVAWSQVLADGARGSHWMVPAGLHAPIRQDAVLLEAGAGSRAARAFLGFLRSDAARAVIESFGYVVPR